jgi:hypothetical protein
MKRTGRKSRKEADLKKGRKEGESHCKSNKDRILRQPDERNEHSQCRQASSIDRKPFNA